MPREDAEMTSVSRRQERQDPDSEYSDASHAENDHDNSRNVSLKVGVTIRSDRTFGMASEVRVKLSPAFACRHAHFFSFKRGHDQ